MIRFRASREEAEEKVKISWQDSSKWVILKLYIDDGSVEESGHISISSLKDFKRSRKSSQNSRIFPETETKKKMNKSKK